MLVRQRRTALDMALLATVGLALMAAPAAAHGPHQHESQFLPTTRLASLPTDGSTSGMTSIECEDGSAGPFPCKDVDLASFVPLPALGVGNGNDVWGWTDSQTGREYAIMGTSTATGFVDVTDPENPLLVGQLPTEGAGALVLWRDIKVNGDHAYIVSEIDNSGLQVFDLTRLRGRTTPTVFSADATYDEFSSAHNVAINNQTDMAYAVGSDTCAGGLHMVDISEPESPAFAGCFSEDGYTHDTQCVTYRGPDADYLGREVCFASNEDTVTIVDVTDKKAPRMISRTGYANAAYTHQGSLTQNQDTFLFGDELDEQSGSVAATTTYVMPVGDLDAPGPPKPFAHDSSAIDHNLYVEGDRVFESNYTAGLRILEYDDASLAAGQLRETAFFDVFPAGDPTQFAGTWSNFRFPRSGTVVVSTIENQVSGLFVLEPRTRGR